LLCLGLALGLLLWCCLGNVNNTDTHYSKHKKVKVSLADVLGTIAKNPLLLKKESDGKVSFTLATARQFF
jgi:hypothetical protein